MLHYQRSEFDPSSSGSRGGDVVRNSPVGKGGMTTGNTARRLLDSVRRGDTK